jgi:hypothetical protein
LARNTATGSCGSAGRRQGRPGPAAPGSRQGHRPRRQRPRRRSGAAQQPRHEDGPPRRHPTAPMGCPDSGSPDRPGHILICSGTRSSRPVSTPVSTCATSRSPPATLTRAPPCARASPQEPRPLPQLHPRRLHGLWHLTSPKHEDRSCRIAGVVYPADSGPDDGPEAAAGQVSVAAVISFQLPSADSDALRADPARRGR